MKATPLDFLLSSLALSLLGLLALGLSGVVSVYLTRPNLEAYAPLVDLLIFLLAFGLLCAVTARWVLRLWPLGEGLIPMTDSRFTVWKLYTVLYEFGCGALKPFTVMFLRPVVQALFGAHIGKDIALGGKLVDPHMIRLEDGAIIGEGSVVTAHAINSGSILLLPVVIQRGATIGVGAVIYPGVTVGEDAVVAANAVVRSGTQIAAGEFWGGVPAKCLRTAAKPGE
jgi:acetyltransferase-like isoleucine patch superfamily enzyme